MDVNIVELDDRSSKERAKDFSELLSTIENVDSKKKMLWKEIYENAITDRQNAYVMFIKLVNMVKESSVEHAAHGRNIATYLERMSRANEQLIRLADLISRSDGSNEPIDSEDMFSKIRKR